MSLLVSTAHCQVAGFAVATVGWMLSMTSMGLAEWRVWHVDHALPFAPGLACVGMWRVCVYHHSPYAKDIACHLYTYRDTSLPTGIRVAQSVLLAASILGLLGKGLIVFGLRHVYVGNPQRETARNLFAAAGILNLTAGVCILAVVVWNYRCVVTAQGVAFPPAFAVPVQPQAQEVGSASTVAGLAASLLLLSALLSLSCPRARCGRVHPASCGV